MQIVLGLMLPGALLAMVSVSRRAEVPPSVVFDHVTVVDVVHGTYLRDQRVVITGTHIRALGRANAISVPAGAQVIPSRGKYLIPGLWDMHVHPGAPLMRVHYPRTVHVTAELTYLLFIANGVTGFRDAWSLVPLDTMLRWRREILAGTRVGPPRQLLSAVAIDDKATCQRDFREFTYHICVTPGDSADIAQVVDILKVAGVDWLKTYNLGPRSYFLLAAAARRAGLRFGGHAPHVSPFDAADSGANILDHVGAEHVGVLDSLCFDPARATVAGCRAVAERFQRTNTWSVPTLSNRAIRWFRKASPAVISNRLVNTVGDFWTNFAYDPTWLQEHERLPFPATPDTLHFAMLTIPMQVGLPMLSGGDTGMEDAGFKTHADMATMVDRGVTPLAALQAATLNPAKLLRATDSMGTVAPGKLADLVLLDANPLADITNTTRIRAVVANGRYFNRAALDGLLAEIKAKAASGSPLGSPLRASRHTTVIAPAAANPPRQRGVRSWCDSIVVADTVTLGSRTIPVVACSTDPADSTPLRRTLNLVAHALTLYGRLTGVPYPWPRYEMQIQPASASGMGGEATGPGTMRYEGPLPDARVERDRPDVTAKIFVHELAHQWFALYVTNVGSSGWLSEGFCDFMTAQVWGATQGPQSEEEFLFFYNTGWSSVSAQAPESHALRTLGEYAPYGVFPVPWAGATIWSGPLDRDDDLYYRGAAVLWMLKQQLGEHQFWASVHTYLTAHAHGTADSHDFQHAIETTTHKTMDRFFTEWVYGSQYPRFTIAATYDAKKQQVRLNVGQTNPIFRVPVTVRVGTGRTEITAQALLDSATQTIVVAGVPRPPTFVVFDDADQIVKTVQFPQPTSWLLAMVQREARPWQTWWAIDQLRQRAATDSLAARVLIEAALQGHYALTRAQAALALGAAPTVAAVKALTQAVHDSAVIVRRGALQGLEAINTPVTLAVMRTVVDQDPSDLVRADAIQGVLAAARVSPAERQQLLAQALATPTYRDVVALSAIKSLLKAGCDSVTMMTIHAAVANPSTTRTAQRAVQSAIDLLFPFGTSSCKEMLMAHSRP